MQDFTPLKKSNHGIDFSEIHVPYDPSTLSKELISYFPKGNGDYALDLGCGKAVHREICEHAGFKYIGLDYDTPEASIIGDAHSLPFKDNSIDFIISFAVFEHLQYPFVAAYEAFRVLKDNGSFIGTIAFLEPFHANSYYHHTHLGWPQYTRICRIQCTKSCSKL